jgi:hypothetical protein
MRPALFALAAALGAGLALLGSRPSWILALAALVVFPLAASVALRRRRAGHAAALPPLLASGLAGGLLTALAVRLAVEADDWFNAGAVDCGGVSALTQDRVLALIAVLFLAAAAAMALNLLAVLRGSAPAETAGERPLALNLYPVAVAVAGAGLVGASFVTSC